MNELSIILGLMFVLILLIFAILVSIAYHIVDLGVDIHLETVKCYQMLSEIQRINENIYFKLDELQMKGEDDGK